MTEAYNDLFISSSVRKNHFVDVFQSFRLDLYANKKLPTWELSISSPSKCFGWHVPIAVLGESFISMTLCIRALYSGLIRTLTSCSKRNIKKGNKKNDQVTDPNISAIPLQVRSTCANRADIVTVDFVELWTQ